MSEHRPNRGQLLQFNAKTKKDGRPVSGVKFEFERIYCVVAHDGDLFRWVYANELSDIEIDGPAEIKIVSPIRA